MERATGSYAGPRPAVPPAPPTRSSDLVESKLIQCRYCDAFVAMLVFAPGANDLGRLEDYARLMYPEYSRRGLPTWIIGPALGPGPNDPADILQVWPTRKPAQRLTPVQFQPAPGPAGPPPLPPGISMNGNRQVYRSLNSSFDEVIQANIRPR